MMLQLLRVVHSNKLLTCMQLDHCIEKMWCDLSTFISLCDARPTDILGDRLAEAFMSVSEKCTHKSSKKRCSIDEVCAA